MANVLNKPFIIPKTTPDTPVIDPTTLATVIGLGSENPADVVFEVGENFPTSFEEWTDNKGNIFIKIPTIYRKVNTVVDNQITSFTMSLIQHDDTYEPYSVFVKPGGTIMDYVCIGKYGMSSSTTANSVKTTSPTTQTITKGRTNARALGDGYQLYDWQFQKLFVDLALVISKTMNFNDGSSTISSYLGICNLEKGTLIDGITRYNTTWYIANDPTKYVNEATADTEGYIAVSYNAPSSSDDITKLGYDENNPFFNYPSAVGGSEITYYCDYYFYSSGSRRVGSTVGYNYANAGL